MLLLVDRLYSIEPDEWQRLSDIGQSYTGVAAIFSVLAFAGVVYSVYLQTQQNIIAGQQAAREMQFSLLQAAMRDRDQAKVFSLDGSMSPEVHKTFSADVYMTMVLRYLEYSYIAGNLSDEMLKKTLREEIFVNLRFRQRWTQIEPLWEKTSATRRERRFVELVVDAHKNASAQ